MRIARRVLGGLLVLIGAVWFLRWKNHDSYKAAFDRLIRDLMAKDLSAQA